MRITRVRLENFKPYGEVDTRLDRGVTVIHGPNGSGKSSLLEACFFALYGAQTLPGTLEDVVRNGTEEAGIEVWFSHANVNYHVRRRVRLTGGRAQTAECSMETDGEIVEGARNVRERVHDLLRMDHEAFLNCAYVRQGEVNKLINATPTDRQAMLDDLLQLGVLEEYRERAGDARLGVEDILGETRGSLEQLVSQIEEKEEKGLHARLNDLESDLAAVEEEIERYEANREEAEDTLADAREIIERHEERREEIETLDSAIEDLRNAIAETEEERDELQDSIREHRDVVSECEDERDELLADTTLDEARVGAIDARREELETKDDELAERLQELQIEVTEQKNKRESLLEDASDLESDATEKREKAATLEEEIEAERDTVAEQRDRLSELAEEIETERNRFEEAPVEFGEASTLRDERESELDGLQETIQDVRTDLERIQSEVERADELLAEGKCPECGQPVDGSPHVDGIEEDRKRVTELEEELDALREERDELAVAIETAERLCEAEREVRSLRDTRETVTQLLEEKEQSLTEKRERIETAIDDAAANEADAESKRERAAELADTIEEYREEIAECNQKRSKLADDIERLQALADSVETMDEAKSEIDRLCEKRELLAERNDERRETLAEKREQRRELRESVDEDRLEEAHAEQERASDYLADVESTIEELHEESNQLRDDIGGVRNEIEELESLRDRHGELEERVDALASLHQETEEMEEMYADLRAELRQQNLASLERLLNETFDLVYGNDAYARIELDANYDLTVYQKDGEALDPEQLSGGERALFNLSLRTAIYRLLAEGIEGAAPMPPLILDEPTVFLDSGHVSRLVDLVEAMREMGVEQIVVVSHDDELVGAADDVIAVEKDPTTNESQIESMDALIA